MVGEEELAAFELLLVLGDVFGATVGILDLRERVTVLSRKENEQN